MKDPIHPYPADFAWGVATSAYQIEGAAFEDGRGPSIWDAYALMPGKILNGENGTTACDHYHLWEQDLDLIKGLNLNAYRFSVAWPRILPEGMGRVNEKGLDFYDRLVDGLLERGLDPHLTLYHWDLPQALQNRGGWANRDIPHWFTEYALTVYRRLGDRVKSYCTFNEPWCTAELGYHIGRHAPGIQDLRMALLASYHIQLAHGDAIAALRGENTRAELGTVLNLYPVDPATDSPEDQEAALLLDAKINRWYLDPVFRGTFPDRAVQHYGDLMPEIDPERLKVAAQPLDFLGVNYYYRYWVSTEGKTLQNAERTDMGWEVYPEGIYRLMKDLHREYPAPKYYITENGAAFKDELVNGQVHDEDRVRFLKDHLQHLGRAIAEGVPVKGYFEWSLMDNFEWAFGYSKRFGIVHVDYETQKRTLKDSAKWYRNFVGEQRGILQK
ncbi:GH1 family beta-glucosidase [Deinococcus cellulosilyticus]|uniref:Beta-glucosidase n=1 Tax=Deinococcus cellulosilyticus (strain DSM 18568 / NBRC 106333 / KACC 11606 / 5516J-15) TaxID=1223518 RepID=A0A511N2T8_DEIC1|nr:GH1 family beta-glucosidase [Deinococcus cellulosilyticus]GEM46746.1 beta-glucosidase [Deinococcus cellulosilyticus NBRC 106333 = KACC 11606]